MSMPRISATNTTVRIHPIWKLVALISSRKSTRVNVLPSKRTFSNRSARNNVQRSRQLERQRSRCTCFVRFLFCSRFVAVFLIPTFFPLITPLKFFLFVFISEFGMASIVNCDPLYEAYLRLHHFLCYPLFSSLSAISILIPFSSSYRPPLQMFLSCSRCIFRSPFSPCGLGWRGTRY